MYIPAAIHLYTVTSDPTLLDCVRVPASDGELDTTTVERARTYIRTAHIRTAYDAYLTLFRNSSTHRVHEFDFTDPPEYT